MKTKVLLLILVSFCSYAGGKFSWSFSFGGYHATQMDRDRIHVESDLSPIEITIHRPAEWNQDTFRSEAEQIVIGLDSYYD